MKKKFPAYKDNMTFIMLGVGFLILLSPVIPLLFDPTVLEDLKINVFAIIPAIIYLFFVYVLLASGFKMFLTYTFTTKSLRLYKPPFHRREIPLKNVKDLQYLTIQETTKIVEDSIKEQHEFSEQQDLVGYIQMIRNKSPLYRYYTIAPQARVTTVGPKEAITSLNVKKTGEGSILLTLKNGECFFLTPKNPVKFKETYDQLN